MICSSSHTAEATCLGKIELWLQEGSKAEVQLSKLGKIAETAGQFPMPSRVATIACPDMPSSSMQVYGQTGQSADPAQGAQRVSRSRSDLISLGRLHRPLRSFLWHRA